ncbi:serine hydrolase [Streptomyces sp. NPDC055886]
MAGESPDKTEQQKSSGTAAEERDPRFAVFRDPGADTGVDADTDVRTDVDAGAGGDAGADADARTGAGSGATSDTVTAVFRPRLPEDAARRAPEAASESEPEPETEAKAEPEPEAEAESASGAVSTASGEAAAPPEGPGAPEGRTGRDTDTDTDAAGEPEAETPAVTTAETPAETPAEGSADEPESGDAAGEEDGDGRLRAAVAAWVDAAAEAKPAADTDGDTDSEARPEAADEDEPSTKAEAEAKAEAEPAPAPEADAEPKPKSEQDEPKPEPEADAESKADAEPDTEPDSAPDAESDAEADAEPDADAAEDASDLRGIDQPTAIFKAVKPTDRVDQATTALKLPPRESKPGNKPGSKPDDKSGTEPESDVERTSTFVPLRSDDVRSAPAPRKPEPGPEAGSESGSAAGPEAPAGTQETASPAATAPVAAPSWAAAERTRQQPLPPRPPLDLLAELTNTPPPPETPVRTAVRRVKIWTPLLLLLLIVFAIVQVMRPLPEPSLELTAKPTYTFDGGATKLSWPGQGQSAVMVDGVGSLGSEGAQKPAPIASVAKVMTAYVILEGHPLKGDEEGETIAVDQKAEDESKRPDESTAPLTKGQELTQRQMLQLLMIPSGNNAARLLARWDAGSEDKFIDKMNDAAEDLGMTGSTYTDPSGLEKTTVSTATDQLKLAQAVMRNEVFRKIVDMPEVEIEGIDGKIYNNNNLLLQPGVSGIKTGSSTPAGGNLLWSANTKVDGKMLWIYGAVMGQQAGTGRVYDSLELSLQNSLKLIKDAQEAATSATVVKKGDVVGYVDNGFGGQTPVVATKNLKAVGWSGLEVELKVTDNGKGIDHAAKAGSEVGSVTVGTGTGKVTAPVVLQGDLTQPAFGDKLTRIG